MIRRGSVACSSVVDPVMGVVGEEPRKLGAGGRGVGGGMSERGDATSSLLVGYTEVYFTTPHLYFLK